MSGPSAQPYGRFSKPVRAEDATEEDLEAAEEAADVERIRQKAAHGANKISAFLGEKFFRVNRTWPFLYWKLAGRQMSVEIYFPNLNLAVDRFMDGSSERRQEAAFKTSAFKEHGVKYKALFRENSINELRSL